MDFPFELKSLTETGQFEGLASTYGNMDLGGDIVEPGAFSESLQTRGREVPVLWAHDSANPVALGTLSDTPAGLHIKAQLDLDTQAGRDAHSRLKKRLVRGLSIGFQIAGEAGVKIVDGVRHLLKLNLFEVSLTALPMNPQALVSVVKSQVLTVRDFEAFLHRAGWSKSEAKALAGHGWKGLEIEPEVSSETELLAWLKSSRAA
jgi:uncharacterized protein